MQAQAVLNREQIKKQIDEIIILMEEQIETARKKQSVIDNLINTTEKTSEEIEKMKDGTIIAEKASRPRNRAPIVVTITIGALIVLAGLMFYSAITKETKSSK